MAVRVGIALTVTMAIFFIVQYSYYRNDLVESLRNASNLYMSNLMKGSLKEAMLLQDSETVRHIMRNAVSQEGVKEILLLSAKGEVKMSSTVRNVGKTLDRNGPTCAICHRDRRERSDSSVVFRTDGGRRMLRNVNLIRNEPECYACHALEEQVLGVLITDFSMEGIDRQLRLRFREMLTSLLLMIFVTAIAIGVVSDRMVIGRLRRFVRATRLFSKGDFEQRVQVDGDDEIAQLGISFNRMAESLKRSKEVREREELLENVLNNISESILVVDHEGNVLSLNRRAERTMWVSPRDVPGEVYPALDPARAGIWERVKDGEPFEGEIEFMSRDGRTVPMEVTVTPLRGDHGEILAFVEFGRDLTEERFKRKLQDRLMHAERLAAIGRLAAGVAHELNNPLGNIMLFGKLLQENAGLDDVGRRNVQRIVDNVNRGKRIISDLLDYSRRSGAVLDLNDINEIARWSVSMVRRDLKDRNITCELSLVEGLLPVRCDRSQIQQIFINLLQNAIEAVGQSGSVGLFTRASDDREGVVFGVSDTGPGIAPELLSRIFEPFYTTKERGIGLGLSICYGIVRRHNGTIWAESGNGNGTPGATLYVYLPCSSSEEDEGSVDARISNPG